MNALGHGEDQGHELPGHDCYVEGGGPQGPVAELLNAAADSCDQAERLYEDEHDLRSEQNFGMYTTFDLMQVVRGQQESYRVDEEHE